jgi:phosphoglycerol transferase MdoB-like AlkP superfamily enzyme
MSIDLVIDLIGWVGAAALIIAYALVSSKRLSGQAIPFQVLNLFGGILLIVNTLYYRAYPSSFLNLVWAGIALATIVRARKPD